MLDLGECFTAGTWCVSADTVKKQFQWVQSLQCLAMPAFEGCSSLRWADEVEAVQWLLPQHCSQVLVQSLHFPVLSIRLWFAFTFCVSNVRAGTSPLLSHFILANSTSPAASYLCPWDALKHT